LQANGREWEPVMLFQSGDELAILEALIESNRHLTQGGAVIAVVRTTSVIQTTGLFC